MLSAHKPSRLLSAQKTSETISKVNARLSYNRLANVLTHAY